MRYEFDCAPYGPGMIEAFDQSELDPNVTIQYGEPNHVKTVKYRVSPDFEQTIPATEPTRPRGLAAWRSPSCCATAPPDRSLEHRELDESRPEPWSGALSAPV